MFKTLLIKEWKDKAIVVLFGLAMMAVFLAAFIGFGDNRDLREFVPAGFLIVFFPFLGLMLGAGAFEAEFRDGAWAYLFSRPVRKETVWLAKLAALLSILAAFGLAFLGLMAAFPGLGRVIAGFKFPELLEAGLELFPLVLLSSLFYFSVAFALSILSEKQLGLVLGSLVLGVIVQGALSFIAYRAELRGWLSNSGRLPWLDAYKLALVLSSLAFLAASLITFRKADFSQPRRKAASLAKSAVLFLAAAWLLSGLWPALRPGPPETITSAVDIIGEAAYFATTKGFYRYDIAHDSLDKIARWRSQDAWTAVGGGKILYAAGWDAEELPPLRAMDLDGSEKRTLLGPGSEAPPADWQTWNSVLSPDGRRAAVFAREGDEGIASLDAPRSLWLVQTDGSGVKKLPPLDPALQDKGDRHVWLFIAGWSAPTDSLILMVRRSSAAGMALWTYELATGAQRRLFEAERVSYPSVSPSGRSVFIMHGSDRSGPFEAAIIDVASGETTLVKKLEARNSYIYGSLTGFAWSKSGDDVAFLVKKDKEIYSPAYYSRSESRLVEAGDLPPGEPFSARPSIDWIDGGSTLVLGLPRDRCLKILDRRLAEVKTVGVPADVPRSYYVRPAGETVFLQGFDPASVWRLDLKTETWKKIF
jgi:ABC-type transport system involved in multi-copper enzyme maturation permease subunit